MKNRRNICCTKTFSKCFHFSLIQFWLILSILFGGELVVETQENNIITVSCDIPYMLNGTCNIQFPNGTTLATPSDFFQIAVSSSGSYFPYTDIANEILPTSVTNEGKRVPVNTSKQLKPTGDTGKQAVTCNLRRLNGTNAVCVCNKTYCDTFPPIGPIPKNRFLWYTSSRDGLRFKKTTGMFSLNTTQCGATFRINSTTKFQTIFGFGGAFTDSAGININSLSITNQQNLMNSYFGPNGIQYTLGRVPIGGTDFSTREYTYMDNPSNFTMSSFQLAQEDYSYKIPIIKKAMQLEKGLKLMGSAWTAPKWMKTQNTIPASGSLKRDYYSLWSDYHIKFLDEYAKNSIKFWALTSGNEPMNEYYLIDGPYFNRMSWSPYNLNRWITTSLGPKLSESVHKNILILLFDENRGFLPYYLEWYFQTGDSDVKSSAAYKYVSGIAIHWYFDSEYNLPYLRWMNELYPDKFLIYTESCTLFDQIGSWVVAEQYAVNMTMNLNNFVTGWVDWNLVLDLKGGPNWVGNFVTAPILVNSKDDEFYKQPEYYVLGHFSKFVLPNSVRIGITPSQISGVVAVAFQRPDGAYVIVFYNQNEKSKNVNFVIDGRHISLTVTGKSINSLLFM